MKKLMIIFALIITVLIGILLMYTISETEGTVTYETENSSDLGDCIWNSDSAGKMLEIINENSVKVIDESYSNDDYTFTLEEYFFNEEISFGIFRFIISNADGSEMTQEQYDEIEKMVQNDDIFLMSENSASRVINNIEYSEEGAVWTNAYLYPSIDSGDSTADFKGTFVPEYVELYCYNEYMTLISLPEYQYDEDVISIDLTDDDSMLKISITDMGISIIEDMTSILESYQEELDNLEDGEDSELVGYSLFESVNVGMEDGTIYNLVGADVDNCLDSNYEFMEDSSLANLNILWEYNVDINEISYIEIDDVKYMVN